MRRNSRTLAAFLIGASLALLFYRCSKGAMLGTIGTSFDSLRARFTAFHQERR